MESKSYNIALVPELAISQKAIHLSEQLQAHDALFVLGQHTCIPHVSLYMTQLSAEGLEKACTLLSSLASETAPLEATAERYFYAERYVDVEYHKTTEIIRMQEAVLEAINPIRDGLRPKDQARLATATGEVLANLSTYGYRSIGTLFRPHVTFTRFGSDQEHMMASFPPKDFFDGTLVSLGIFEMGENGTCAAEVMSWELRS